MRAAGFNTTMYAVANTPLEVESRACGQAIITVPSNKKYFDFISAKKLACQFDADEVDVIWFRDTRDMDLLGWVKRFSRRPFKLLYQQAMQFGVSKRDPLHTFRFMPVDAWLSTLHFLADQVRTRTRFPEERIHVIPLGCEVKTAPVNARSDLRNQLGLADGDILAGIIGRIDPLKDQLCAVHALQFIRDSHPHVHLLIAGESTRNEGGDYERSLRRHVNQLDLQDRIHFLPHTPNVEEIYTALDLFLMTSKGETFGTVTIEAMHHGIPVIGTRSSGTPEILDEGRAGLLYTPGSADELANLWRQLADHKDVRIRYSVAGRARAGALYSREASVSKLSELIFKIVQRPPLH